MGFMIWRGAESIWAGSDQVDLYESTATLRIQSWTMDSRKNFACCWQFVKVLDH